MKNFNEFCKEYICDKLDENWNDEIELTPDVIEAIKEQIEYKKVSF